ncbi:Transposase IS116/IS110/IS902 family protein [Methylobacterium sp. UNC300MFChir4.1]|uniref:transposase n=1 Tax=Methylobacterium sp. UNC300MFChir4.1 TaxID=1502747 RepID=UPI0008CB7BEE|nr:transposase [Methylobacterium sp. UNC300MFChir4.1]SEP41581.1 Transposase IS116/IS110/IS902 family protein [Methylobacterium sp. UNC300MFChir4.1]
MPDDEHAAIKRHLRELDTLGEDLAVLDRAIGEATLDSPVVRRLLTVTGINVTVAAGLAAAIGDVRRFSSPQKLVSYFGLNPRVRQSGLGLAQHGRISKAGRSHARALLVEAAWAAAKAPGPLHAFFVRVRAQRGHQIAAVATARKLAVLCWHLLIKEANYLWGRPAFVANKIRGLELQAGQPQKKGNQRGPAYASTTSTRCAIRRWRSPGARRPLTSGSWRTGRRAHRKRCADASNRQGSNEGGPAGLAAEAPRFATRSSAS